MAHITIKTVVDKKEWERFMSQYKNANFLQSWYWGVFHESLGHTIHRVGFYENNTLVGIMLSIVEKAKRGIYVTVPAGPLINWDNRDLINAFVQEIKKQTHQNKAIFIRVRPQLINNEFSQNIFRKYGFVTSPIHLHAELTLQLDITPSEHKLLENMRKTTRYEIKKAIRHGIQVIASKEKQYIRKLYDAQIYTAQRQRFSPFSYKYLLKQFETFVKENHALIYKAEINNIPLAYAFIIFYGKEAIYHYGATTQEGKKYGGAYLIQWKAIQEAKKRKMKWYNFWGVSPDNPSHRFYRLSVFKRGFGGREIEYLPAHDLITHYPLYAINYAIELIRKKLRHL